jgi:L-rhamnose-H+ transport protein
MLIAATDSGTLLAGFGFILIAAVAGGAFGLQYRVMRQYSVENSSLLSLFFATIVVPLIAVHFLLPGWTDAIRAVGWKQNLLVYAFGFGWGMGAITYAFGFNILGMALAASLLKGITIAIGAGIPLLRRWDDPSLGNDVKTVTILGLTTLIVGTAFASKAGSLREKGLRTGSAHPDPEVYSSTVPKPMGKIYLLGLIMCLLSGVLSSCANLGYDFAEPLAQAMGAELTWKATLIRWMPMYWGGMTALIVFMGGSMIRKGTWRNYFRPGTGRDLLISSAMGAVHFLAQIPYGIGAYYLGKLGTTVGWGVNIGMALIVASSLGFALGEWKGVSPRAVNTLLAGIAILVVAIGILAYANSLVAS